MKSLVDTHPERSKIITMLIEGVSVRRIASAITPPISYMSIWKWRKDKGNNQLRAILTACQTQAQQSDTAVTQMPDGRSIVPLPSGVAEITRAMLISRLMERYEQIEKKVRKSKSEQGFAAIINAERGNMEFHAKITGAVQEQPSVQVLVLGGMPSVAAESRQVATAADQAQTIDIEAEEPVRSGAFEDP